VLISLDLDDQRAHVLDEQIQADGSAAGESLLIGRGESPDRCESFTPVLAGVNIGRPLLTFPQPIDDFVSAKTRFRYCSLTSGVYGSGRWFLDEELLQVAPHQRSSLPTGGSSVTFSKLAAKSAVWRRLPADSRNFGFDMVRVAAAFAGTSGTPVCRETLRTIQRQPG